MKRIEYKGYFIKPSCYPYYDSSVGVSAFPSSAPLFYFVSIRAAKCWITRHLSNT